MSSEPRPKVRSSPLAALGLVFCVLSVAGLARSPAPIPAPARETFEKAETGHQAARLRDDSPMDLNRASAADLQLLPRIGPTLAARIVEDRATRGPFRTVDDLTRVRGIGPATLARVRDSLVVEATPIDTNR